MHFPSQNDVMVDIFAEGGLNGRVNGVDLYDFGDDAYDFYDSMMEIKLYR